jgi:uncharacterized membrane protein required for colicin V production
MKYILILLLLGFILAFWFIANAMNKPILNKMHNYYEDDKNGRQFANMLIGYLVA